MAVMRYLQEAPHFAVQRRELLLGHLREQLRLQQLLRYVRVVKKLFLSDSVQQVAQSFRRFNLRHNLLVLVCGHVEPTARSHAGCERLFPVHCGIRSFALKKTALKLYNTQ